MTTPTAATPAIPAFAPVERPVLDIGVGDGGGVGCGGGFDGVLLMLGGMPLLFRLRRRRSRCRLCAVALCCGNSIGSKSRLECGGGDD